MLDLRALKDLPIRLSLVGDASTLDLSDTGVKVTIPIRVDLEIMGGDNIFYCNGQASCDVEIECARCLKPYQLQLNGAVEFSIQEVADIRKIRRDEIPDTEFIISGKTAEVDISGPVREALILEIPLMPLCADACLGICPICGNNRNEQLCDCKVDKTDSRWEDLHDLT